MTIGTVFCVLFLSMAGYTSSYAMTHKEELIENEYNTREETLLDQNVRGSIYSSDGQILAQSTVDSEGNQVREYPFNNLTAHAVGYASEGGSGVELYCDYDLIHSDLTLEQKAQYSGVNDKFPGNNVFTTLDMNLQQAAYDALGSNKGAIVVTDVDTGAILAMVSKPDFDPNNIEELWDTLVKDDESGTLVNRVTQGSYAPGSTFKIMDVIELLQEDPNAMSDYSFTCTGSFSKDDFTVNCFHGEVHGTVDLESSFADSCNCSFANIGLSLDRDKYKATLENLYFDQDLPYDMPSSQSHINLDDTTSSKEVIQLAIGQGQTTMSPLHLNMITAAIANGGTIMRPYLVDQVQTAAGTVLKKTGATAEKTILSESDAQKIRQMMRSVITDGTATRLDVSAYEAAGKTGSAEYKQGSNESHAWFTGFAPYDDPKICVTVIIEGAGSGGEYAVPAARKVFDAYFGTDTDSDPNAQNGHASYVMTTMDTTTSDTAASESSSETADTNAASTVTDDPNTAVDASAQQSAEGTAAESQSSEDTGAAATTVDPNAAVTTADPNAAATTTADPNAAATTTADPNAGASTVTADPNAAAENAAGQADAAAQPQETVNQIIEEQQGQ